MCDVFKGNLIPFKDFYFGGRRPGRASLRGRSCRFAYRRRRRSCEARADRAGNPDETLHTAEVVLGAVSDHAAEVGCGIHAGKISVEDDVGLGSCELQNDPGEFTVADKQVEPPPRNLCGTLWSSSSWRSPGIDSWLRMRKRSVVPPMPSEVCSDKGRPGRLLDAELRDGREKF